MRWLVTSLKRPLSLCLPFPSKSNAEEITRWPLTPDEIRRAASLVADTTAHAVVGVRSELQVARPATFLLMQSSLSQSSILLSGSGTACSAACPTALTPIAPAGVCSYIWPDEGWACFNAVKEADPRSTPDSAPWAWNSCSAVSAPPGNACLESVAAFTQLRQRLLDQAQISRDSTDPLACACLHALHGQFLELARVLLLRDLQLHFSSVHGAP